MEGYSGRVRKRKYEGRRQGRVDTWEGQGVRGEKMGGVWRGGWESLWRRVEGRVPWGGWGVR